LSASSWRVEDMNRDFRNRFWALVQLRYMLLWANVRTGNGKLAWFFALYLIGGLFILFFALGGLGMGAALGAIEADKAEYFARWMLAGLFVNGVGLSLLFGVGPRTAFSEEALRRYPLNAGERFLVRQVIGILDPIWLLLIAATFGLAIGFILLGNGSVIRTLLAAVIFLIANYVATILLLTVVGLVMETRTGSSALGLVVLALVSFGPLTIVLALQSKNFSLWHALDNTLRYLPPGAAAGVIVSDSFGYVVKCLLLLLLWSAAMVWALQKLEKRPRAVQAPTSSQIVRQGFYDQIGDLLGGLFGQQYAPLISKSLRYQLRCNMILFSLLTAPVVLLFVPQLMLNSQNQSMVGMPLMLFYMLGAATAAMIVFNTFGYDEAGIRRYAIVPATFVAALRAGNLASLLLRLIAVLVTFALWMAVYGRSADWRMVVLMFNLSWVGVFLFNAVGFWTSVYSPKRMNFDAMWNNRLSAGGNIALISGMVPPMLVIGLTGGKLGIAFMLHFWWLSIPVLALCIGIYVFSFHGIAGPLRARREELINLIAGATD